MELRKSSFLARWYVLWCRSPFAIGPNTQRWTAEQRFAAGTNGCHMLWVSVFIPLIHTSVVGIFLWFLSGLVMDAHARNVLGYLGLTFIMIMGGLAVVLGAITGFIFLIYRSYTKQGSAFVIAQSFKAWKERTCAIIRFTE